MNPTLLKKEIIKEIKVMPAKDLRAVAEFVDFIRERELEEEILNSKRLIRAVKRSKKAWKTKKLAEFVDWKELRQKFNI